MHTQTDIIETLKRMKSNNATVVNMLKQIKQLNIEHSNIQLISLQCFRAVFNLSIGVVSPIAGWKGFGGTLTDHQINDLVGPFIYPKLPEK